MLLPPSSSLGEGTSDNLEEFADELTLLKKGVQEENFQVYSNPLFEFDDNFTSSNELRTMIPEDEDNSTLLLEHESPNLDHQDNPSSPRTSTEPTGCLLLF
ncbi:hypothetical protein Tco_0143590 [Tanacetum coccineum]|uniref:Uncharacterized protein n=1 Tax=Tanacetum coccineum TaxID=301880 RepID=A0ABQ5AQ80_9ASTR